MANWSEILNEIVATSTSPNKDCDLRPRPVSILFEGIAGQISEARRV